MATIKLKASDNKIFEIDLEVAKCMASIKVMVKDCGLDSGVNPVPLPNVSSIVLAKIIEWATYHKDDEPVEEDIDDKRTDNICTWDKEFLKIDQATLFEILVAANFLDIKPLVELCCKTVANMITVCASVDEIRKKFSISKENVDDKDEVPVENLSKKK